MLKIDDRFIEHEILVHVSGKIGRVDGLKFLRNGLTKTGSRSGHTTGGHEMVRLRCAGKADSPGSWDSKRARAYRYNYPAFGHIPKA
jgi:hypothetical protein